MRVKPLHTPVSREQHTAAESAALLGVLKRLEMSLESLAIFVLGLDLGLQLLDEKLEPPDFIAQLLNLRGCGR
jgi:hypothetical protein